ncbi:MAG: hypothetical protein JW795_07310 [Chitinivibrionales bacterium]|nr:hypothetical protein [Chitinivibrionales bacterium]
MHHNKRWYDKDKKLSKYLEYFKTMKKDFRDELVGGIMDIIKENQSSLIDDHVLEFPLNLNQRRWYDKDPYLWLIFNGLSKAENSLLEKVKEYLEQKLKEYDLL